MKRSSASSTKAGLVMSSRWPELEELINPVGLTVAVGRR
jgi:hypothetical protein